MFLVLRLSRFAFSRSIVTSVMERLVIPAQIAGRYGKVDDIVPVKQRISDVKALFDGQSAVMMSVDDHVFLLIRYPVQGNLLSPVISGKHIVQRDDCHILPGVFRGHGVLIAGVADEAVFLYPA